MSRTDADFITTLLKLRQSRKFTGKTVEAEIVDQLLEVARWTGSAKNTQPWEFIVVDDHDTNVALSRAGQFTGFLDNVALSIALVLPESPSRSVAYDEGRVSERLMLAADHLGLGSGTAWFSTPDAQETVRSLLDIPSDRVVWSAVGFGYTDLDQPQRATSVGGGRKPLAEIVSYGRYGQRREG